MRPEAGELAVAERPKHGGSRKGSGRPKTDRIDKAVKIERALADMAFVIAKHRGITIAKYLSEAFRATINRDYGKIVREVDKREEK